MAILHIRKILILILILAWSFLPCHQTYSQDETPEEIKNLNRQAENLAKAGRYQDAIPLVEQILAIEQRTLGAEHLDVAGSFFTLGSLHYALGKYHAAEDCYKKALAISTKRRNNEYIGMVANSLGVLYCAQGDYRNAQDYLEQSAKIQEEAFGPDDHRLALTLNNLGEVFRGTGEYSKAEEFYRKAITILDKTLGPNDPQGATCLSNLGLVYCAMGKMPEAQTLFETALVIKQNVLGREHPDVATVLNNLALCYHSFGDYRKAEAIFEEVRTIYEKSLGPEHPNVGLALNNLGDSRRLLGEYLQAQLLVKRSLALREKVLGPNHLAVAESLNSLGLIDENLDDFVGAKEHYRRALKIIESSLGPDHPMVAQILVNLGSVNCSFGAYEEAEPLYKKALKIREKTFGSDSIPVAETLSKLAVLCSDFTGDYKEANRLYEKALEIEKKTFGPDHPEVASALSGLGIVCQYMGDLKKAERCHADALRVNQRVYGPEHPDVAENLDGLARVYSSLGDYPKAEELFLRSLNIREKVFGPNNSAVGHAACALADFYVYQSGDYRKALPLYLRSLTIVGKVFGLNHPDAARIANSVAGLARMDGDYDFAKKYYSKALEIAENVYGKEHPDVATSMNGLATVYHSMGEYGKAEGLYKGALRIAERGVVRENIEISLHNLACLYVATQEYEEALELFLREFYMENEDIQHAMSFTSDDQKTKLIEQRNWRLGSFLSFAVQHMKESASCRRIACDQWLKRKGITLEAQKRFQEALIYCDDREGIQTAQELARARQELSALAFSKPWKTNLEEHRKALGRLDAEKQRLEAAMSRLSQEFALRQKAMQADSQTLARALPRNSVFVDFAEVKMANFTAKEGNPQWLPTRYLAFVIHAGEGEKVAMVDLGDAETIDAEVAKFKELLPDVRDIKGAKAQESSRKLYEMVFAPIKKELGATTEIFISPDGNLNLLPFEVLRGPDEKFLIEDYCLNYLAAGRDLLGFGGSKRQGGKSLLMGDPDFDLGVEDKESTLRDLAVRARGESAGPRRSSDMRGLRFARIPATREEVTVIGGLLGPEKSEIYLGKEALEEVLMQRHTPKILHLATHGFLLKDVELVGMPGFSSSRGIMEPSALLTRTSGSVMRIENPLLRSGIVLAGANRAVASEDAEKSDGIVTAEKILGLNLRGTDMVVLSACETGLGEVKVGEGVYGLRRAFAQAGAKSLVMTMWAVPDKETKELMIGFYRNILSGRMNRCQALRQASLAQMKIVKERYGYANPFHWGAFIFMGEP